MLMTNRTNQTISTAVSGWWRNVARPIERATTFSAENNRALSTTTVGLSAAGLFFPPLHLLAAPSLVLTTLPAYRKMIEDWQDHKRFGDAALEASLVTLFVVSDHLLIGAAGVFMLTIGQSRSSQPKETESNLPAVAFSTLAIPVAGISGALATLYATLAQRQPRQKTQQYLRQHDIEVHNWLAARKLPKIEAILLDQSCLMAATLEEVRAFHHRLAEDVAWYALAAAPSGLRRQLKAAYPDLPKGATGANVQLLTRQQLQLSGLIAPESLDDLHYVVVNQQVIGALRVLQTPVPAARQLIAQLRKGDRPIILLSDASVAQTEDLLNQFALDEAYANMGWQQKVDFCREQKGVCFIGRDVPSAQGLADVAITLSDDPCGSDVTLSEAAFGTLANSMGDYAKQRSLRRFFTTAPTVVTIGGVFFLQWGMPMAVTVQGISVLCNYMVDRRLKPSKVDPTPAPAPLAAFPALAV